MSEYRLGILTQSGLPIIKRPERRAGCSGEYGSG